jgi:acyl-CoA thioester hydrolase
VTTVEPVSLRFRDVDSFGHVYHAEYLTLLDELRTRWFRAQLGLTDPTQYVVARVELDYVSSLVLDDASAGADIVLERIGNTSLTLRETMRAGDGREVARCRTVVVLRDASTGTSRRLTEAERTAAERLLSREAR